MNKFAGLLVMVLAVLGFLCIGCVTQPAGDEGMESPSPKPIIMPFIPQVDYSYPLGGSAYNVNIASKDFTPVGIIFLKSEETVDSRGNHTGSKITYEMFMREAERLGAHAVININIDVNYTQEKQQTFPSRMITITKYSYTGTGLAIRYTNAINNEPNKEQDISTIMSNPFRK